MTRQICFLFAYSFELCPTYIKKNKLKSVCDEHDIFLLLLFFLLIGTSVLTAQSSFMNRLNAQSKKSQKVEIKVFPNPVVDHLEVTEVSKVGKLVVYNLVGRELKRFTVEDGKNYYVGDLPGGMYLVQILNKRGKKITTQRVRKS